MQNLYSSMTVINEDNKIQPVMLFLCIMTNKNYAKKIHYGDNPTFRIDMICSVLHQQREISCGGRPTKATNSPILELVMQYSYIKNLAKVTWQ